MRLTDHHDGWCPSQSKTVSNVSWFTNEIFADYGDDNTFNGELFWSYLKKIEKQLNSFNSKSYLFVDTIKVWSIHLESSVSDHSSMEKDSGVCDLFLPYICVFHQ